MSTGGVVAIIPARGGSKRLPRKNIAPFFGKPLLAYTIEACQQSKLVTRGVYVSTEDPEIAAVARQYGARVIDRPAHLAEDTVWTQDVLQHAVRHLEGIGVDFDVVARVHCSPQIEMLKIDEAIHKLTARKLWEVFSVGWDGTEDAVIHVLRKKSVWQAALSVYKGVIQTGYLDIHTQADLDRLEQTRLRSIEQDSLTFLHELEERYAHNSLMDELRYILGRPRYLWVWQMKVPLWQRWQAILAASPELRALLYARDGQAKARTLRVLDVGSGFGMYWPILREFGVRNFVGIDLFDKRGDESYYAAAQEYVARFCGDCKTKLIMDDVRNLGQYISSQEKFDVILAVATASTKRKSTGIPRELFDQIVREYGAPNSIPIYVENVA